MAARAPTSPARLCASQMPTAVAASPTDTAAACSAHAVLPSSRYTGASA